MRLENSVRVALAALQREVASQTLAGREENGWGRKQTERMANPHPLLSSYHESILRK